MSDETKIDLWKLDHIQFPRLLAEIAATQDSIDWGALCEAMDLPIERIDEIFDRATAVHEWNVDNIL